MRLFFGLMIDVCILVIIKRYSKKMFSFHFVASKASNSLIFNKFLQQL